NGSSSRVIDGQGEGARRLVHDQEHEPTALRGHRHDPSRAIGVEGEKWTGVRADRDGTCENLVRHAHLQARPEIEAVALVVVEIAAHICSALFLLVASWT